MSKVDKSIRKAMVSIFMVALVITGIFFVMMFGPAPQKPKGLFSASVSYYTKGTEKLFFEDYAQFITQNLYEIGIDASLRPMEYALFLSRVIKDRDYQLALLEIEDEEAPHLEFFLKKGATLNIFGFDDTLDNGTTTSLMEQVKKETNFTTRQNLFYKLSEHIVNDTLPFVPLFTPIETYVYWDNLRGYYPKWGISNSLPYMYFENLHTKQTSTDVLKIGIGRWQTINPFDMESEGEKLLVSLIMDKLIIMNPAEEPTKFGIINNWSYQNSTTLVLNIRPNVIWQPTYDGSFGTHAFTTADLVFTLNQLKNPNINTKYTMYDWIKSVEILNSSAIIIHIDSDPKTPTAEPYAFALEDLTVYPLPQYYLHSQSNNTQLDMNKWSEFLQHPFGTGKYTINFEKSIMGGQVTLERFNNWYNIGVFPDREQKQLFSQIIVKSYTDTYSMMLELQQGSNIDIGDFGEDPAIIDSIREKGLSYTFATKNSLVILAFNLNDPVLGGDNNFLNTTAGISKGLAIRKAIAYIIDRVSINNALHEGVFNITDCPIPYYHKNYYYSEVTKYDYSVKKAMQYLEIAGFNISGLTINTLRSLSPLGATIWTFAMIIALSNISSNRTKKIPSKK